MKILGIRALGNDPSELTTAADAQELVLITNRNRPLLVAVPFDERMLKLNLNVSMALRLFESGSISLVKAATLADVSVETFMQYLAELDITVVDYPPEQLESEAAAFELLRANQD